MQCVGTLSWSGMGWPSPASSPSDKGLRPGRAAQLTMEAPEIDAPRPSAAGHAPGSQTIPAAAHLARVEVNPLETDWSHVVRRCMDGDSGAWAELVRTHHRRVYGLCYRFSGNPADAEDLTQEVFLKVYSNLARFDTVRGSLQVWRSEEHTSE